MKLKLLIAPLLMIVIVVVIIWVIIPNFRNFQEQKENLKIAQQKVSEVQMENQQAAKLKQELAGDEAQRSILLKYIPAQSQEELLVGGLSSLASGEGLSIFNMAVTIATSEKASNVVGSGAGEAAEISAPKPFGNTVAVNLGVSGPYEKIKSFINKLATLKRHNNIVALKISRPAETAAAEPSNNLQADLTLNFAYQANDTIMKAGNKDMFSNSKLFSDIITQLNDKFKTDIAEINIGTTGKVNLFIP